MPSSKKIFIGKKDGEGKLIPDNTIATPNIKRVDNTAITFPAPRTGDGTYEPVDVTNGRYLFYDGDTLVSKVFSSDSETPGNNGELFFDGNVDGTQITLADGIVTVGKLASNAVTTAKIADLAVTNAKIAASTITPAKMASQTKTLSSLSETPDYIGQPGRFNSRNWVSIALTGTMWVELPNENVIDSIVLNEQQTRLGKNFINSLFAGYNCDSNTFTGFSGSNVSIIPNDESCIFTKTVIKNMHRFSVPSSSSSGGIQHAAVDFANNGAPGCFGAWFRKSSLASFLSGNQGINFGLYQTTGSPTKTNTLLVKAADLTTVGFAATNTANGYTITVKVVTEINGWMYITFSFDIVLSGYTTTRLVFTWANSLNGSGFNIDLINPTYLPNATYIDPTIVYPENSAQAELMDTTMSKLNDGLRTNRGIPNKALKIAMGGTSITDGTHVLLSEGYFTGLVADYVYNVLADCVKYNEPAYSGSKSIIYSPKFYKNAAYKLTGAGAFVEFDLYGDELMLAQAMERSETGAAMIELYVDGVLYDKFSNYNTRPKGTGATLSATGDGSKTKFSLGKNFCYNPRSLTVNGVAKTVKLNTFSPPVNYSTFDGFDALLIRKYETSGSTVVVNNYLWFKVAPGNTHAISLTYDYGENITPTKCSIGEIAATITNAGLQSGNNLESFEGDGVTADLNGTTITTESLDFRSTNPDAIKIWRFNSKKRRTFKFLISGLDPRGSGTPYFIFNFAANKAHQFMNAGIHGNTTRNFAAASPSNDLRTIKEVQKFKPDIYLHEGSTNDDKAAYNSYVSTKQINIANVATIKEYPLKVVKTSVYNNPDYTVETAMLVISSLTETTITIDATDVTFGSPAAGDILIIGNYHIDNRFITARVISAWNAGTKTATFKEPLVASDLIGITSLADLVNMNVRIFRADDFKTSLETIIDAVKDANPDVMMAILSDGLPNNYRQNIDGYPALMKKVASDKNIFFGNIYREMLRFQYAQVPDVQCFLNDGSTTTSDGSTSFTLKTAANANPCASSQFMKWSVLVNGVEVFGKDCYIDGGNKGTFASATVAASCIASSFTDAESKMSTDKTAVKLTFFQNVPANGDTIIVKYSSIKVADDDVHPNLNYGNYLFAKVMIDFVKTMALKISSK